MSQYSDIIQYVLDLRERMRELHERVKALEESKIFLNNVTHTPVAKLYPSESDRESFTFKYIKIPEENDNQD